MTDAGSPASVVRSIDARPGDDPPVRLLLHNMAVVISRAPHDPRRRAVAVAGSDGAGRIIADRRINRAAGALVIAPRRDLARGGQRSGLVEAGLGPVGRSPAELVAAGRVWTRDAGHVADELWAFAGVAAVERARPAAIAPATNRFDFDFMRASRSRARQHRP